jgi:hypothetical protein
LRLAGESSMLVLNFSFEALSHLQQHTVSLCYPTPFSFEKRMGKVQMCLVPSRTVRSMKNKKENVMLLGYIRCCVAVGVYTGAGIS